MTTAIIHLSDFHNVVGRFEGHRVVVDSLFDDLQDQLDQIHAKKIFLAFSGDIAQKGNDENQYSDFLSVFDSKLNSLGIPSSNRICVPGNHDLSQFYVNDNFVIHEGIVS